jgi:hypothetical protein
MTGDQPIWKFLGNRFVEEHALSNAEFTETELSAVDITFVAIP